MIERPSRPTGTRFEGRVWLMKDGRPYRKSVYGPTRAAVRQKLREEQNRAAMGLQPTPETLTVARFIDGWLARDRDVAAVTLARYRSLLLGHVVPVIGDRRLVDLRPDDVRACLSRMKARGLSTTTQAHVRTAFRLALGDAVGDGLVSRNVASKDAMKRVPTPQARQVRALSDAEMRAVLHALEGDRLAPVYRFIAATGCRLSEALGLRWRDVRWDRDVIEISQTLGRLAREDVWGRGKNDEARNGQPIRLTTPVRAALIAQKAAQDAGLTGAPPQLLGGHGPLVFTALDGGPLSGTFVTHRLRKLLERAGIEPLTAHTLRHLYVSKLFERGVPLEVISGLVRHKSPTVTRAVYLHLRPETQAAAADMLDDLFADTAS